MTTPSLAAALQRRLFEQQLAKRTYTDCFVACALHDFWCQVAQAATLTWIAHCCKVYEQDDLEAQLMLLFDDVADDSAWAFIA